MSTLNDSPKIFMNFTATDSTHLLQSYKERGGYEGLKKALLMKQEDITSEVVLSNLRGRGGAGFPAGKKWQFLPKTDGAKYLCCNADEGEPGTFKDRWIMEKTPHQLIEGMLIASFALGVKDCFLYIRGEFDLAYRNILTAVEEAKANNLLGDNILGSTFSCRLYVHQGAGAYVCGEETSLLTSLEGMRGLPRNKPPFPAIKGLFKSPTVINNVETLATVPWIICHGGAEYAKIGTPKSTGTRLMSLSGHINNPGVYEVPMGISFQTLINDIGGGVLKGKKLKAVIPGGSSTPILLADEIMSATVDYESVAEKGSMLGSGATIVVAEGTCMVTLLKTLSRFYKHESCGQCTPCREGTGWLDDLMTKIVKGQGTKEDIERLKWVAKSIQGNTICALGDAAAMPVAGMIQKFPEEFEYYAEHKKSKFNNQLEVIG